MRLARLPAGLSARTRWPLLALGLIGIAAVLVPVFAIPRSHPPAASSPSSAPSSAGPVIDPDRPNIVYVLTDDLSWNLVPYMPHVLALERQGMTFTNFTVTDSLCCPSRASILTGDFPHDTHVLSNDPPTGGFDRFTQLGDDRDTIATALSGDGYRTALVGKYLNHYEPELPFSPGGRGPALAQPYVPPGWSSWNAVDGRGYAEYGYTMAQNHTAQTFGRAPQDYLTNVAEQRSLGFVDQSVDAHSPFFLEVATFAPHAPYVPAPIDVGTFAHLHAPRDPAFAHTPAHAPPWLARLGSLPPRQIALIDAYFERRVEAVQAVDRMIGALERRIADLHLSRNTIFVFNSDNGYHMGQYNLRPGKMTAFDTDVRVPLIIAGPGVVPGSICRDAVENIDLRPTFDELAGTSTPGDVDGRSIVPLLQGRQVPWRTFALVEHDRPDYSVADPDRQRASAADPPSYTALRTARFTYVRYVDGEHEYYDRVRDPSELDNVYATLPAAQRAALDRRLAALVSCHGAASCWAAAVPTPH